MREGRVIGAAQGSREQRGPQVRTPRSFERPACDWVSRVRHVSVTARGRRGCDRCVRPRALAPAACAVSGVGRAAARKTVKRKMKIDVGPFVRRRRVPRASAQLTPPHQAQLTRATRDTRTPTRPGARTARAAGRPYAGHPTRAGRSPSLSGLGASTSSHAPRSSYRPVPSCTNGASAQMSAWT